MCGNKIETTLSGFTGLPTLPCHLVRPSRYHQFMPQLPHCIARGSGSSYSDAAINQHGVVISTRCLNRFLAFDVEQGILTAEAGVTLKEICQLIMPYGWFLPVAPGTAEVSLGGAVSADIHGKNHVHQGTFSQHILWIELITATQERIRCSATDNADLFWATVGGMGLIGLIGVVCFKLKPIANAYVMVKNETTVTLDQTIKVLTARAAEYEYSVAWLDACTSNHQLNRGVVMSANHANQDLAVKMESKHRSFSLPFKLPINLIQPMVIHAFNAWYYRNKQRNTALHTVHYQNYFYPLDKLKHWRYLYGKKGFIQYQCLFPLSGAVQAIHKLLALFRRQNILCSLVVLKCFGPSNKAPLSFAREGITVAIDMPFSTKLPSVLTQADELVVEYDGRVYLAKDTHLSKAMFIKMYPDYLSWLTVKQRFDPNNLFQSSLSLRLL